ncbi:hypothetical protein ID866_6853 [Astraeus odoratus]|nr:hypothetical protein ID866_6853 [Astraeus odoratus]
MPGLQARRLAMLVHPAINLVGSLGDPQTNPSTQQDYERAIEDAKTAVGGMATMNSKYLFPLQKFGTVLTTISGLHPYAKLAFGLLDGATQIILAQTTIDDSLRDLVAKISQVFEFIMEKDILSDIQLTKGTIAQIAQVVHEAAKFVNNYSSTRHFWHRLGRNVLTDTKAAVDRYNKALDDLMLQFRDRAARDMHLNVYGIREDLNLDGMVYAAGVGLNTTKKCLDGTRIEILNAIIDWINDIDVNAPRIFWLHGQAGKGKSAIAHTVALHAKNLGVLGSCFCFTRVRQKEGLQGKLIPTIARDLVDRDLRLRPLLVDAIASDRSLKETEDVLQQWQKFILEPLSKLRGPATGNVVMVIDALDESGGLTTREDILDIFSTRATELPQNFRILLTSRPLRDITDALQGVGHVRELSLDNVPVTSTRGDIQLYVAKKLVRQRDIRDAEVMEIAEKADGLFEWARLACEFIRSHGAGETAKERFGDLVERTSGDWRTLLDGMYDIILSDIIAKRPRTLLRFHSVMRQILYTLEPLPIPSLNTIRQGFSSSEDHYDVEIVLDYMAPLLSGITDHSTPIRPLHASFYDFLTDRARSGDFFINKLDIHCDLALAALNVMHNKLCFNICGLESSYLCNSEVVDLPERIKQKISPHLSYACRFWAAHVQETSFNSGLAESIRLLFHSERVLFWLEVLGLLESLGGTYSALTSTQRWLEGKRKNGQECMFLGFQ